MTVKEFLKATSPTKGNQPRRHAVCGDGSVLSIQASASHYSIPRQNNAEEYTAVEVLGLSGENLNELKKYSDGKSGIYGWVPVELLEKIVEKHGGIQK